MKTKNLPNGEPDSTSQETTLPRYSDEKLAEFKKRLLSDLKKAESVKKDICEKKDSLCSEREHGDFCDNASFLEEKQNLISEEKRNQALIENIQKALVLIEQKKYGVCRETGNLIPEERLVRAPFATLCVGAKNKRGK